MAVGEECAHKAGGYYWDRKPLWGYVNEADPYVMEAEIEAAVSHGVNVFIYDWYWFDGRPFLEQCLNKGFLGARNREKMKFYLMWANHDANHCWNRELSDAFGDTVIWRGDVSRPVFDRVVDRIVGRYFSCPNYYKIDGRPVFMIYDVNNLIKRAGRYRQDERGGLPRSASAVYGLGRAYGEPQRF